MKRILLLLVLTATTLWSCAQPLIQRAGQANTVNDPRHMASKNSIHPTYADTAEANLPANIGLDSAGAIIYTEDVKGFWYRQHNPKKWVRFSDVGASTVNNIRVLNDSLVVVCTGEGACDTLDFDTHIVNVTSSYFLSDTSIVICNTSACDTAYIPRQPVYLFQNGLTTTGNITEWGGSLLHATTLNAGYYPVLFTGGAVRYYPWRFYQQQGDPSSTGIISFGRAGHGEQPNSTYLSLNFFDSTFQRTPFIGGYFGRRTGYALATNLSGDLEGRLTLDDPAAKVAGLFFNAADGAKNSEAFTLFGLPAQGAGTTLLDSLAKGKILTGHTNRNLTLWGYPSTRNDGTLTKALGTDTAGNVILGTLPTATFTSDNGLTNSSATNVQLGGTLLKNTTIAAGAYTLSVSGNGSSSLLQVTNSGTGGGVFGTASGAGTGVYGSSGFGTGIGGYSANGLAGFLGTGQAAANTAVMLLKEQRETSGTAADGIGYYRSGYIEGSGGPLVEAFREGAKLSTAANATATALYEMELVSAGTLARKLALAGSGKLTLDTYGDGLHTGTATYALASDADGNVIEIPATAAVSADNGLSINTGANVQLGGTLLKSTTIAAPSPYYLEVTGDSYINAFRGVNTSSGAGVYGSSALSYGVQGVGAAGVYGYSTQGEGGIFSSQPATTNSVHGVLRVERYSGGTPATGMGAAIDINLATELTARNATRLISKWTNATDAARTSQFELWGLDNTVAKELLRIGGAGVFTLVQGLPTYADNAAAIAGGMSTNQLYKTASGVVMIVYAP
jgi:hypothetical protein